MTTSQLIAAEILRTYNENESEQFLQGAIHTLKHLHNSLYQESGTTKEVLQILENFTSDEGLQDLFNDNDKHPAPKHSKVISRSSGELPRPIEVVASCFIHHCTSLSH